MALKGFMTKNEREEPELERPAPLPQAAVLRTVSPSTSVDAGTELEGTLRCKETLRIDGSIKGSVECEKSVLVGECARIEADISGDEVTVAGGVRGDITAQRKITLQKTAVVKGDLTTPGIVIEEGAKVKGRIVIGSDPEPASEAKPAREERKAKTAGKRPAGPAEQDEAPIPQAASAAV